MVSPKSESNLPWQNKKPILWEDCGVSLVSRKKVLVQNKKLYMKPIKIVHYKGCTGLLDIHDKKTLFYQKF